MEAEAKSKVKPKKKKQKLVSLNRRTAAVMIALGLCFIAVAVKLFFIHFSNGAQYSEIVYSQTINERSVIKASRGDILDSNGMVLATSNTTYNLILDPRLILTDADKYREPAVNALQQFFGFSPEEINSKIAERPNSSYVVLKKHLTYNAAKDFIDANEKEKITGVWLENNYQRNYTFGSLASSVIGFMREDYGLYGLEYQYNDILTGSDGRRYSYISEDNMIETEYVEPVRGKSIKTTIDYNIQAIVEAKIKEFMSETETKTVACIIQDPQTGAILAMYDSDDFDCNAPYDLSAHYKPEEIAAMSDNEKTEALSRIWTNFCITQNFEPGSTAKPFTLATGLEEGSVTLEDHFYCPGYKEFKEHTIHCHVHEGHGDVDTREAISESCNVALMEMAAKIGAKDFTKYQNKFGFGKYTDIDLPNEANCRSLVYDYLDMRETDLATNAFGQNFNVTMIQMSTAFCSLINGGYYYKPYVVQNILDDKGNVTNTTQKVLVSRPVCKETSDEIKECLRKVVVDGTGDYAQIDGYVISGKTGTGEKAGREEGKYVVSFCGFCPYENPEVVCYVVIDEPENGDEHGVSSTLFNMIMSEVLPYMNVTTEDKDFDPYAEKMAEIRAEKEDAVNYTDSAEIEYDNWDENSSAEEEYYGTDDSEEYDSEDEG